MMIGGENSQLHFVSNFNIQILDNKIPPHESCLSIHLRQKRNMMAECNPEAIEKHRIRFPLLVFRAFGPEAMGSEADVPQDPDNWLTSYEVGSSSIARNESATSINKNTVPEKSEIWRHSRNNRLKIWSGLPLRSRLKS
ncbi:hypothetical protein Tco_0977654 [Tanacetum coccineum]|uniref:Uncharacterized protein n=1 Tax=Tanacetum coccineum TaxID=301880 RepID=A0ABQ5EKY0_9ASTR